MSLLGSVRRFLPSILVGDPAQNVRILDTGILTRGTDGGHECRVWRSTELRSTLERAGPVEIALSSPGGLTVAHKGVELPEPDSPARSFQLPTELEAGSAQPGLRSAHPGSCAKAAEPGSILLNCCSQLIASWHWCSSQIGCQVLRMRRT